jgi:hypothetical protein
VGGACQSTTQCKSGVPTVTGVDSQTMLVTVMVDGVVSQGGVSFLYYSTNKINPCKKGSGCQVVLGPAAEASGSGPTPCSGNH